MTRTPVSVVAAALAMLLVLRPTVAWAVDPVPETVKQVEPYRAARQHTAGDEGRAGGRLAGTIKGAPDGCVHASSWVFRRRSRTALSLISRVGQDFPGGGLQVLVIGEPHRLPDQSRTLLPVAEFQDGRAEQEIRLGVFLISWSGRLVRFPNRR